jgi:hypothetical protein
VNAPLTIEQVQRQLSGKAPYQLDAVHTDFARAEALAKQRAQMLALADDPRHAKSRRSLLSQARRVERIIVGIAQFDRSSGSAT